MGDEELRELADQFGDLTEMAQQVLRDEMRKRRLGDPGESEAPRTETHRTSERRHSGSQALIPPPWDTALVPAEEDDDAEREDQSHEYTWKTLLCECETKEQAWQIYEMLRRAGIESWIEAPRSYALELASPRVVVAADQVEEARLIAAQPIPQEIAEQSKFAFNVPEFKSPHCPRCQAGDPVLESVDPCNAWSCEICGHEWTEADEKSAGDAVEANR